MNSGEEEPGEAAIPMSDLESHQSRVVNPEKSKEFSKWRVLGTLGLAVNRWKDKETPEERQRKWQNRRLRLVQRSYGGVKEDVVDNISTLPTRKKPSLLQYAKEEVLGYPPKTRDLVDTSNIVENILNRDDEPSREFGVGFTGHILNNQYDTDNYIPTDVRKQMDEMEDYRPFFSYWVTTVQTIILIITMCWYPLAPLGLQLVLRTDFIFTESLAYQQVSFYEPNNFWIGPSPGSLIHLGAVYAPCMRRDRGILQLIEESNVKENEESGCCVRNDGSGCLQTTVRHCSPLLSTFFKWNSQTPGPNGRLHGPVCGQDPRFCSNPLSKIPHEWADDLRQWPVCLETSVSKNQGIPSYMRCGITAKPCCVGIHGRCEMRSREYCDFVGGYFHPEASLCSQVSCMQDVCGLFSFLDSKAPDQFYRLWTSLFLHAGIVHLLISILVQWFIMRDLERLMGPLRMATLYFGAGIFGNAASAIFVPHRAESGPSGAHFGLIGALFVEIIFAWPLLKNPWRACGKLLLITSALLVLGFLPWVDNYAHIFGLFGGFLLSFALLPYVSFNGESLRQPLIRGVCGTLFILLLTTLQLVFYMAPDFQCEICKRLSCIPLTPSFCAHQNVDFATETTLAFF